MWNVSEPCWEHGPLDAAGKKHGLWFSWYASGTLRGEEWFRHGAPHGLHRLVRGAKGESPFDDTFAETVHRCELDFARGMLLVDASERTRGDDEVPLN